MLQERSGSRSSAEITCVHASISSRLPLSAARLPLSSCYSFLPNQRERAVAAGIKGDPNHEAAMIPGSDPRPSTWRRKTSSWSVARVPAPGARLSCWELLHLQAIGLNPDILLLNIYCLPSSSSSPLALCCSRQAARRQQRQRNRDKRTVNRRTLVAAAAASILRDVGVVVRELSLSLAKPAAADAD